MKVILGVSGSISAYKAIYIMRLFQKNSHSVSVIMTPNSLRFVTPLTFETFCPGKVYHNMFEKDQDPLLHINIGKENDLLLLAPATANIIGKIANGIADDLLSSTFLAFNKTIVVAPAMNTIMFENSSVQDNLKRLKERGVQVIEPDSGSLACSDEGKGKLPAPEYIYEKCVEIQKHV
jgi:phosphopantothenoylcysteine decarboxylase/phosphopantothenate--cysteine ligase